MATTRRGASRVEFIDRVGLDDVSKAARELRVLVSDRKSADGTVSAEIDHAFVESRRSMRLPKRVLRRE